MSRIIVFGAGGFVGGWICEQGAASGRHQVTACLRRWTSAVRIARRGIPILQCAIAGGSGLVEALKSFDVVVNATAGDAGEAETIGALYDASAAAGVCKFIHISSAAVYGDMEGQLNEANEPEPADAYGRGKRKTETDLLRRAEAGGPQLFILRPSIIYGSFSQAWTVRYAQRILRGRWKSLGDAGTGTCNLIHAQDVALAALAAAEAATVEGAHILNLNGPEPMSWNAYIERLGDALGIVERSVPGPLAFASAVAASEVIRSAGRWAKAHSRQLIDAASTASFAVEGAVSGAKAWVDLYPTEDERRLLRRKAYYDAQAASQVIAFSPSVPHASGIADAAQWCLRHGVI